MANLADLMHTGTPGPMGVASTVHTPPDDLDDLISVTWTSPSDGEDPDEDVLEQGVKWACRDGRAPVEGDYALLFTDSRGDPVALVWGTGRPLAGESLPVVD